MKTAAQARYEAASEELYRATVLRDFRLPRDEQEQQAQAALLEYNRALYALANPDKETTS